jgi:hypothetical protein
MSKRTLFYLIAFIILGITCWFVVTLLFGYPGLGRNLLLTAGCWLFVSGMIWAARKVDPRLWIAAGLLLLAALLLPLSTLARVIPNDAAQPFATHIAFILFLLLSLALIITAMLLLSGLVQYRAGEKEGKSMRRTAVVSLLLGVLLLAKILHSLYWLTVWDSTYDSMIIIWLLLLFFALFLSTILLVATLPGSAKLLGLLYLIVMPFLLLMVTAAAQRVDFRQLTEDRAARVSQAIEAYYDQEGYYPEDLRQLTPQYIISLPEPVILLGQTWCYDGGEGEYRLGYVDREHWSDPRLFGHSHKSTYEEAPHLPPLCEDEIAALIARAPKYYEIKRG